MLNRIDSKQIEALRGRLIAQLGRNVEWQEFAKTCELTPNTIANLRTGRTGGTLNSAKKIVKGMRSRGLDVSMDDLFS